MGPVGVLLVEALGEADVATVLGRMSGAGEGALVGLDTALLGREVPLRFVVCLGLGGGVGWLHPCDHLWQQGLGLQSIGDSEGNR